MKNKILVSINDFKRDVQEYLNYCAFIGREFDMKIELVASAPEIYVNPVPTAIIGSGLSHPSQIVERKVLEYREEVLQEYVDNLKVITDNISYDLKLGDIEERLDDNTVQNDGFMWTINRKNDDSMLNQLFGTHETMLSKETSLPALVVPEEIGFVRPKTLMIVLNNYSEKELSAVKNFAERLKLNLVFAYYAEDGVLDTDQLVKTINSNMGDFAGIVKSFSFDRKGDDLSRILSITQPDWISFLDFDRSFIERFYKMNTNQLILSSSLPVVIF